MCAKVGYTHCMCLGFEQIQLGQKEGKKGMGMTTENSALISMVSLCLTYHSL